MSWISTDPPDDDAARLLASLANPRTGATDEILKIHALDPVGLRAHLALYRSAMSATAEKLGPSANIGVLATL